MSLRALQVPVWALLTVLAVTCSSEDVCRSGDETCSAGKSVVAEAAAAKRKNPAALGFRNLPANFTAPIAQMDVQGTLPSWLNGSVYRNGPAWWDDKQLNHWFLGLAMLHVFHISDGGISYNNQFLQTSVYRQHMSSESAAEQEQAKAAAATEEDGEQAVEAVAPKAAEEPMSFNTPVTIRRVDNHLLASTGVTASNEFDARDVSTVQAPFAFDDAMGLNPCPAHAHTDLDGTIVHFHYVYGPSPGYQFYTIAPGTSTRKLLGETIPAVNDFKFPQFMHTFALTENYAVLSEIPAFLFSADLHNAKFVKEWNTKWQVVDRRTGRLHTTLESPGFMMFHHINAYEDMDENGEAVIVADVATFQDMDSMEAMFIDTLINHPEQLMDSFLRGAPHRYVLPLSADRRGSVVQGTKLWDGAMELPTIAYETHNTRKYRYFYGLSATAGKSLALDKLVKVDIETPSADGVGSAALTWERDGCYPGEPLFVARPGSSVEDDGVIVSIVLDTTVELSFLLVLDGKTFEEVATAPLTYAAPFGFHGRHYFNATALPI